MRKTLQVFLALGLLLLTFVPQSQAAYVSRFDAINFDPAVDSGNYFTVYGSRTHKAWQGNLGFYGDYANRPLEFKGTGTTSGRQSVLDHMFLIHAYGSLGFTDWFTAGINIPFAAYNVYFSDDATAAEDSGGGMGDIRIITKFRFLDVDKTHVGISLLPFVSFPTGDIVRYNGNGHIMGGANLIFDFEIKRFSMALNAGYTMRDDVTRTFVFTGGATSSIRMDDLVTAGVGANFKVSKHFQIILEGQGSTVLKDFLSNSNTTAFEAGGGVRLFLGNSGFTMDLGGTAGIVEGVGTPRYRGILGLNWTAPEAKPCPECAPDPRIQGNKIVLWGKIFFDTAKTSIKPISYPVLDDVVDVLMKNQHITLVEVQGHTDWRGSDDYNLKLSQGRAESSMQYLISKGISPSRLRAVGYGETRPIASNETVEGMSQNRRVEFVIIGSSDGSSTSPANNIEISELPIEPIQVVEVEQPKVKKVNKVVRKVKAPAFNDDMYLSLGGYSGM